MRFVIGLVVGLGAGLAGAILLAPDRSRKNETGWTPSAAASANGAGQNHDGGLKGALRSLQDQINTAMSEARQASDEAEQEMRARYEEAVGKTSDGKKKVV